MITFVDFVTLAIGYMTIRAWMNGEAFGWPLVHSTIKTLAGSITKTKQLWDDPANWPTVLGPTLDMAASISGLLVMTALLKVVWNSKEFTRDQEDYWILAGAYLMAGEFRKGLISVNKAKISPNQQITKATLELACDNSAAAIETFRRALAELKLDSLDDLAANTPMLMATAKPSAASVKTFFHELLNVKVGDAANYKIGDAALNHVVQWIIATKSLPAAEVCDFLNSHAEDVAKSWPITFATLLSDLGRNTEAYDRLVKAIPKSDIDDIIRRILLFDTGLLAGGSRPVDEDLALAQSWFAEHAAKIGELVSGLKTDTHRILVLAQLIRPIIIARDKDEASRAFYQNLRNDIRATLQRNPQHKLMLHLEDMELQRYESLAAIAKFDGSKRGIPSLDLSGLPEPGPGPRQ
jgi:hypothetical protein